MKKKPRQIDIQKFDENMRIGGPSQADLEWHSPKKSPFRLEGFAWFQRDGLYRRMPRKPKHRLSEAVEALANCTAGGQIRFQTDSRKLVLRVQLIARANMDHMAPTGQCGFDCYLGPQGHQRYLSTTRLPADKSFYEFTLFDFPKKSLRNITLNFPLYQGVQEVRIGLEPEARVKPPLPFVNDRPIVIYGTSITQGGCASRPGMAYTNILSRRLNRPVVNLGFSGSGRGEPEVARIISEIKNPACLVLDYEANCNGLEKLRETFPEFIRILRAAHPRTPILALTRYRYASECVNAAEFKARLARRDFQAGVVRTLRKKGDRWIFFRDASNLLGKDFDECTVDGVHATDLGFMRMADALTPVLRALLKK